VFSVYQRMGSGRIGRCSDGAFNVASTSGLNERAPAAQFGNVLGAFHGGAFADESLDLASVVERQGSDAQRCGYQRHKTAELVDRDIPQLNNDACALIGPDQTRFGRDGVR